MRKILVGEFVSLDGIMEGPGPSDNYEHAGWTMPYFSDEVGSVIGESMAICDAFLLGRVTYQGFADAFSSQTGGETDYMNNQTKYVVSSTLKEAAWKNSQVIKGNVVEEIQKLKQQPGKNISVSGSCTLLQTLIQHDLVDEYSLLVYPVVLGNGKRLFGEGTKATLRLKSARPLKSGVVVLTYEPDRK